jgi:hypothetical protein
MSGGAALCSPAGARQQRFFPAQLRRSATVNQPVISFGGWRFARISNAMGAHGKRI